MPIPNSVNDFDHISEQNSLFQTAQQFLCFFFLFDILSVQVRIPIKQSSKVRSGFR
jgi:hypothetical protein